MGITISDIKRAISGNGDVSAYAQVCHRALGNPPVPSLSSLEVPVALPDTREWLRCVDASLATLVAAWAEGQDYRPLPEANVELTLVGLAPYGRNIGGYLETIIDEIRPDIIALDISPLELSANLLYAFSLPCAIGLPAYGDIISREGGQFYASESFYPGNMHETAIVKSWRAKIPLLAVGVPQLEPRYAGMDFEMGYSDESYVHREMATASVLAAYQALDASLSDVTRRQEGAKITRDICHSLLKTMDSKMREVLVEDACYIASRLAQIATYAATRGEQARLLAIVDISHYPDVEYVLDLLRQGISDEVYVPPKGYAPAGVLVLAGRDYAKPNESVADLSPASNLTQELFHRAFDRRIKSQDRQILLPAEVDKLIAEIVSRTRTHPEVARGASVRGTIAFKEVVQGLSAIQPALTRDTISKAALITLPPRISGRQKGNEIAIVSDIAKEVLYDIRFSRVREVTAPPVALDWLSPGDIVAGLKNLKPLSPEQSRSLANKELPTIVAEAGTNQAMLKYLESRRFLKKGETNRYSFTRKAIEYLMQELERKLQSGAITSGEYKQEKDRLMAMLPSASQPQFKMSARELANTIMELMDAQDKQWSAGMSFERMHIYYHIKANSGRDELSPQKRDYDGLKTLIDDLEQQGILRVSDTANGFTLTGAALDTLLEYLIDRVPGGRGRQSPLDSGRMLVPERKPEIRRYSSGDFFSDISVRHTLKEIARQKKSLSSVSKSDFRVFMKQHRKLQSDIVLCLDTSASMGSQHKLMYARLAATGLAKAAIENGDRVGVVTFDNFGQTTIPLTGKDKDAIIDYIIGLSARGNTNIGDGIKCASQLLSQARSHNQKHIVLVTDGQPTAISERDFAQFKALEASDLTEASAILETRKASARGIKISVIHLANRHEASGEFIRNIARNGRGKVRRISGPGDLATVWR